MSKEVTRIDPKKNMLHIVDVFADLATLTGNNAVYTSGLCNRIECAGVEIENMTVAELLEMHHDYNNWYNKVFARA